MKNNVFQIFFSKLTVMEMVNYQEMSLQRVKKFIKGFKNIMKIANPEEEVDIILAEVDKNNSGFIDYHGF